MVAKAVAGVAPEYAGDVSPAETWAALRADPRAQLVDVRSDAEWSFVGAPDLGELGREPLLIAWQTFPGMKPNPAFVDELRTALANLGVSAADGVPIYFLCRSGARSRHAAIAMTRAGFSPCYNIAGGFEGDLDGTGHRGARNGWKAAGLRWQQT